jgi:phage N-6-adenine-methyltransferase
MTDQSTGASFARGESKQDYATPPEFIAAVKRRFGIAEFAHDLAASAENAKATAYFDFATDSLSQNWRRLVGHLWLNPPFAAIASWAAKCAESSGPGRTIYLLVPAAVGSNWHAQYVDGKAMVYLLNGRICFDGNGPYPKDCMLCVYGLAPGYEVWTWKR